MGELSGKDKPKSNQNVAFLFHMYQPPWQSPKILDKISKECYSWLTGWLSETKDFKIALNLNYSLTELLIKNNQDHIIENIGRGVENGSIEFTGSAAYHALLPLIPESEIRRQIEVNHSKNAEVFKGVWEPKGFFPPEMAISKDLARIVKDMGYEWIITDSEVYDAQRNDGIPYKDIATILGLPVFFRSHWSNKFAMDFPNSKNTNTEQFVKSLHHSLKDWFGSSPGYASLAFDIETIGHHQPYTRKSMEYLAKTMKDMGMASAHFTELLKEFPERTELITEPDKDYRGSWSAMNGEIQAGIPYSLWSHPENKVHKNQWKLANYAIDIMNSLSSSIKNKEDKDYINARDKLDKGLNSCPLWWATPGRWNQKNIMRGVDFLYSAVKQIAECYDKPQEGNKYSKDDILKTAEKMYNDIRHLV